MTMTGKEQFRGQPRLPKFIVPKLYDINLKPDLAACTFDGTVNINLEVVESTSFIVLNVSELKVHDFCLTYGSTDSSQVFRPSSIEVFLEDDVLVAEFSENPLPIGKAVLSVAYDGILNDKMKGFYRSTYELNGDKKNMAVTQFESVDARRCFPCWDEPALKATFKITLDVPSDLTTLSNMPVKNEVTHAHLKTVSFKETPIMSTYLVAVVIGQFDFLEDSTSDGINVRVYCQVGKANQGKFALNVAVKTLDLYKKYFGVSYALPKLDMVAIPDFAAGAMENYGLVTYRETALLYDDLHSASVNKQRVTTVVAHELAHQWFGNLVTMEWWTHLWLNEGFATWVSYLAADSLFPEWKIWTQFLDESTEGFRMDALAESHPIEVDINHANEVDEIFDAISYKKGASVIRMLQSYLGPECFQRALAAYIKKYSFSNAKTEDLWAVLEEVSGEPVNKLMNSWTKQAGFPVVSVKLIGQKLEFEQSQFLSSGDSGHGHWIVPTTLCCGSYDSHQSFLFESKSKTVDLKEFFGKKKTDMWIKFNVEQAGFYRVKYDEELSRRLRYAIKAKQLSAIDRFGILDDSFALSIACQLSLGSLLMLMDSYKDELDYTVLSHLISMSYKIIRIAKDATPYLLDGIEKFFIQLFQYSAKRLSWDPLKGESHLDAMLRGELLVALASYGHEPTQKEAIRRFDAFLHDRNTLLLPPDLRKAAYVAVMKNVNTSNRSGFDSLLKIYRETDLSQEKTRILGSLGSSPDPAIILEVLNFLLSSEVRSQDAVYGIYVSIEGREITWTWFKDNWDHIEATYGSGLLLTHFVSAVVSPFASVEKVKEVESFFSSRGKPSISRTLKQSIENVCINAKWVGCIQMDKDLARVVADLVSIE